jgi:hypothetical protein
MRPSNLAAAWLAAPAALGLAMACMLALGASPARALPPATGSQCSSNWVNNAGAMACFTQGEEEARNGVRHPHYVACVGGDVFCCVDNNNGNQNCIAQARGQPAGQADWLKAILGAHRNMTMSLGRYSGKTRGLSSEIPTAPVRRAP